MIKFSNNNTNPPMGIDDEAIETSWISESNDGYQNFFESPKIIKNDYDNNNSNDFNDDSYSNTYIEQHDIESTPAGITTNTTESNPTNFAWDFDKKNSNS